MKTLKKKGTYFADELKKRAEEEGLHITVNNIGLYVNSLFLQIKKVYDYETAKNFF